VPPDAPPDGTSGAAVAVATPAISTMPVMLESQPVWILIEMIDTLGVKRRSTTDNAVHFVPFCQQQLRQIGAILACDPGNESFFHRNTCFPMLRMHRFEFEIGCQPAHVLSLTRSVSSRPRGKDCEASTHRSALRPKLELGSNC
jgi:hypothetical protein